MAATKAIHAPVPSAENSLLNAPWSAARPSQTRARNTTKNNAPPAPPSTAAAKANSITGVTA